MIMARNPLVALVFALLLSAAPRSATAGESSNGTEILSSKVSDGVDGEKGSRRDRIIEDKAREREQTKEESGKEIFNGDLNSKSAISTEKAIVGEDCGAENRCVDEKNSFVACLRVPGDESPNLSLLIINKGSGDLTVNVQGLEHASIEQTAILLQGNDHKKVLVKVDPAAANISINLTSGDAGNCQLTFTRNDAEFNQQGRLLYPASFVYLVLAALALFIAIWLAVKVRRARRKPGGILPVSGGGDGPAAGWEGGWEGSWGSDDEDTPRTPSKAVSSPSLKRLAPRRSGKLEHTA